MSDTVYTSRFNTTTSVTDTVLKLWSSKPLHSAYEAKLRLIWYRAHYQFHHCGILHADYLLGTQKSILLCVLIFLIISLENQLLITRGLYHPDPKSVIFLCPCSFLPQFKFLVFAYGLYYWKINIFGLEEWKEKFRSKKWVSYVTSGHLIYIQNPVYLD